MQEPEQDLPSPHYYVENGNVVFTEAYHLERGTCCGSGCRHCPYLSADDDSAESETPPENMV